MSKLRVAVISFFISSFLLVNVSAQTISSYSALGIGDLYLPVQAHSQGMGGIGISNSNVLFQSTLNPALLADNSIYSFAAGAAAENKAIWQNDNREKASAGTLAYLSMVLPIKPGRLSFNLAMMPYSNVNYNFRSSGTVEGNPDAETELFNKGTGGFNQFALSAGLKIVKGLYIGGKAAFVFSTINQERNNVLTNPAGAYVPTSVTETTASDFVFGAGAAYRYNLSEEITATIGVVYDFGTDLGVIRSQTVQIKAINNTPISVDTLLDNVNGYLQLPNSYGLGFSLNRLNKWTFGTDVRLQNWSEYKDFDGNNDNLVNALLFRIGAEITPNSSSVDNYFERVTYRLGLNVDQTPYSVSNTQIDEIGINFGLSLPVSNFSSVDLGFRYGSRGTLDNNLIREDFFRIYFGVTFNDNRWFIRPKYN
jgi:hypothetical protein